ncbi:hypothetical protein JW977_00915 [Candidatus Falkowbacteria bacterium]|nr:hypothetical protein [Candidatus Falkowbacteria bacterium]
MDNMPCLKALTLHIGDEKVCMNFCNLDNLIDVFGEPENQFTLPTDERFRIFSFFMYGSWLRAFLLFQDTRIPPYFFESDQYDYSGKEHSVDRGVLAELHFELDVPFSLDELHEPLSIADCGAYKIAIFNDLFAGRLCDEDHIDIFAFMNPNLRRARQSFLFQNIWFGDITEEMKRASFSQGISDLQSRAKKSRWRRLLGDYAEVLDKTKASAKIKGPTKK